jgi:hypothetical protein
MKITAKLLSAVLLLSVAQGCALQKKEGTTFVVAQQTAVTTTTEFVDSPEQRAADWAELDRLDKAGLLRDNMPRGPFVTSVMDPTDFEEPPSGDEPEPPTLVPPLPVRVLGEGCARGADGVLVCPPTTTVTPTTTTPPSTTTTSTTTTSSTSTTTTSFTTPTTTVEPTTTTTVLDDSVAPVVSVLGVTNSAVYSLGGVPAASCSSSDLGSGVAVQATLARTGGNVDGTGTFVVTCSGAVDRAGNVSTPVSISYRVRYVVVGGGIGGGSSGGPVNPPPFINTGKAGRAYSAQWQLSDVSGVSVTTISSIQSVTYRATSCVAFTGDPAGGLSAVATGNSGLTISGNTFKYNWKTPIGPGCYTLFVNTVDGASLTAHFKLT